MVMDKKWIWLVAIFVFLLHTGVCQQVQQKILMSTVNTITLREGKFTTGRRVAPVRQLRCVSAAAPCKSIPTVVQCYNKGSDGFNIQWRCEAQMSKRVMFDTIQVSCEGYDHPNDPYILAGSCGLTYSLRPSGRRRHRNRAFHKSGHLFHRVHVVNPMVSILTGLLALTVVVAMLALVFKLFRSRRHRYHRVYTAEEGPPPHAAPYGYHHGGVNGGSGPGFWTGAAVGGMAGYMMGSTPHHFGGQSAPCEVAYESDFVLGGDDGGGGAFSDNGIGSAVGFGSGWNR